MATTFLVVLNNAESPLSGTIDTTATSLVVLNGALFPSTFPFHISIDNEIIKVGGRSGNSLTSLTRAQESTVAATHGNGAEVELRITAQQMSDIHAAINALEGAPPSHDISALHTGALSVALHGILSSGDLHPEYQTPAEHTAIGDAAPHHTGFIGLKDSFNNTIVPDGASVITMISDGSIHIEGAGTVLGFGHNVIAAGDLHTEYQEESEKNAHGGYGDSIGHVSLFSASGPQTI